MALLKRLRRGKFPVFNGQLAVADSKSLLIFIVNDASEDCKLKTAYCQLLTAG